MITREQVEAIVAGFKENPENRDRALAELYLLNLESNRMFAEMLETIGNGLRSGGIFKMLLGREKRGNAIGGNKEAGVFPDAS